jgi:hypothetical protein
MNPVTRLGDVIVPDGGECVVVNGIQVFSLEQAADMSPTEMVLYAEMIQRQGLYRLFGEGPPPSKNDELMLQVIKKAREERALRREINAANARAKRAGHPLRDEAVRRFHTLKSSNPKMKPLPVAGYVADSFSVDGVAEDDIPHADTIVRWAKAAPKK